MTLFRPEALAAHSGRHAEGIVTTRPRLVAPATAVALILGMAVLAFGYYGSYSARVSAMSRHYEAYQRVYPALRSVFPDRPST